MNTRYLLATVAVAMFAVCVGCVVWHYRTDSGASLAWLIITGAVALVTWVMYPHWEKPA